jgi:hypothetical protein
LVHSTHMLRLKKAGHLDSIVVELTFRDCQRQVELFVVDVGVCCCLFFSSNGEEILSAYVKTQ